MPSNFKAIPANPKEIVLTWQPPLDRNGVILNYIVHFKAEHDDYERKLVIASHAKRYRVQELQVKMKYTFWMAAVTSKGVGNSTKRITAVTAKHGLFMFLEICTYMLSYL